MRTAVALGLLVLSVALFPSTLETITMLHHALRLLVHPSRVGPLVRQLATPGAGEEVLPAPVPAMILLLRAHGVRQYRYSTAIARDELIRQRLLEGAVPIRYHPGAPHLLLAAGEPLPAACASIASRDGVTLARCP